MTAPKKYRDLQDAIIRKDQAKRGAVIHTIDIPSWNPVPINKWRGRHWGVRHKLQRGQAAIIGVYALQQGVPKATGRRKVRLTVYKPGKAPDADAYDKSLLDALVTCGLLVDDSQEWIEGRMEVVVIKSKQRRTLIRLEDV